MREIKFRGFNKRTGVIVPVVRVHLDDDAVVWWSPFYDQHMLFNAADYPLMQHTGLSDKNGKEIYEGDVVKRNRIYEVVFDEGSFQYSNGKSSFLLSRYDSEEFEVIGNIYENPELLKGGK